MLEDRARGANAPAGGVAPRATGRAGAAATRDRHPDQQAAAEQIADALGGALGIEVSVKPRGTGYRVELAFEDPDEALALARRLRPRVVARP